LKPKQGIIPIAVAIGQLANAVLRDKKRTGWMMHCIDAPFFWQRLIPDARADR